jgi:hypothetical protein
MELEVYERECLADYSETTLYDVSGNDPCIEPVDKKPTIFELQMAQALMNGQNNKNDQYLVPVLSSRNEAKESKPKKRKTVTFLPYVQVSEASIYLIIHLRFKTNRTFCLFLYQTNRKHKTCIVKKISLNNKIMMKKLKIYRN